MAGYLLSLNSSIMARNTNWASSHWVGSLGYVTSILLRGATVVKQKSLGPTNTPTPIQVGNRAAMAFLVAAGRFILGAIDPGFRQLKVKKNGKKCANSAWGAYSGQNRAYANGVFDYTVVDAPVFVPANFIASKGTITPTDMSTATGDVSAQTIAVSWTSAILLPGQNYADRIWIVIHNQTQDTWGFIQPLSAGVPTLRSDNSWTGSIADTTTSFIITDVVRIYTFFEGVTPGDVVDTLNGTESDSTTMLVTLSA